MALLPYEKTYAVDMTRGITAATPPASLNIASLIVADTGPVERVTLTSQKDLVDTFCVGSAISATDNETIQFNGALLTQVATDVFRVDTSAMRIGVGSLGTKIYFDKDYNMLDKVTRAIIKGKSGTITSLYIELQKADSSTEQYYMGEAPDGFDVNTAIKIDGDPDIDTFFKELYKLGVFLEITETSAILNPIYTKIVTDISKGFLGPIGNVSTDVFSNVMNKYTAGTDPADKDYYIVINGAYELHPNNAGTSGEQATTSISIINAADLEAESIEAYPVKNFMVKALDCMYSNDSIPDPWAQDVSISLTKTVKVEANEEPTSDVIEVSSELADFVEIAKGTWVEITDDGGTPDDPSDDRTYWTRTDTLTVNNGIEKISSPAYKNAVINVGVGPNKTEYKIADLVTKEFGVGTVEGVILTIAELESVKTDQDNPSTYTISSTDDADGKPYFLVNGLSSMNITVSTDDNEFINVKIADETPYLRLTHASTATNDEYKVEDQTYIIIDNYVFYAGTKPTEQQIEEAIDSTDDVKESYGSWEYVVVSKAKLSISDFLKAVVSKIAEVYTVGLGQGNYFLINGIHDFEVSPNLEVSNELIIDQSKYDDEFAVVCKFTSSQPLFQFEYTANEDEYNTIDLTYQFKSVTGNFTMSFDGAAIDGYGKSLFYENYNEGAGSNPYIFVAKLNGEGKLKNGGSNGLFGDEVMNNDPTEADYAAAILKYLDVKEKQYNFVTDAGHMSVALAGACKQVADERFCQYVPSFPPKKNTSDLISYEEGINLNDFRCQYLVPSHKSTYNGQFLTTVPASLTYMFARVNAFNTTVAEFSPLFGTIKGTATAPNLIKNFTKAEAQTLADHNINVITRDISGTYIRSNFTSQKENSYLSEDQNAYMTNILCHICEEYNPLIIAELNTAELRGRVVADLSNRIQQRMIVGKNPTLASYLVKCDEELNTPEVIEARQLIYQVWVQYTPSIAYVLAYVFVKRLGSF
jgi:hypothetical protein